MRRRRGAGTVCFALALLLIPTLPLAQTLALLDVPFIAQSELLCGGAAASMVMRYWGERGVDAGSFASLVETSAGGIRTTALVDDLRTRGWSAAAVDGSPAMLEAELRDGRPVIALIEDHPRVYHYVVVVGRNDAGVVFHDPARAPFRVATTAEFDRKWSATRRWMLVLTPAAGGPAASTPRTAGSEDHTPAGAELSRPPSSCDALIAAAVDAAGRDDLAASERMLASALSCPGSSVFRELAGVRVRQERWPEAADMARAAVSRDRSDTYAWKLLATALFVGDDKARALDAWNAAGEPRLDLIRLDGLGRTRYSVVEHELGLRTGTMLTRSQLLRAQRRLNELPSGSGTLDYVPEPSGLAEIHGVVADRPLLPRSAFDLGVLGLATALTREAIVAVSSPTGGGERVALDWRFWAHRPLYQASFIAPAPWTGVWALTAARERQPFSAYFAESVHDTLRLDGDAWTTGHLRWQIGGGVDRWQGNVTRGNVGVGVRLASSADRADVRAQSRSWFGQGEVFHSGELQITARSSAKPEGTVLVVNGGASAIGSAAPPDLWFAGDTGRARPLLLRAHPIIGDGERFLSDRLARFFIHDTTEVQQWWRIGPFRIGGAAFVDAGRSAKRVIGPPLTDVDAGVGFRGAYPGKAGAFRADVARGLRDGETAFRVVYTADLAH